MEKKKKLNNNTENDRLKSKKFTVVQFINESTLNVKFLRVLETNEGRGKYELGNQTTKKMIVAMQLVQCKFEITKSKF